MICRNITAGYGDTRVRITGADGLLVCADSRFVGVYADGKVYIDGGNTVWSPNPLIIISSTITMLIRAQYVPRDNGSFNTTPANGYDQGMSTDPVSKLLDNLY